MHRVIINADDFGMSEAYNLGVIKSYRDGVVSSTSLMVNMDAAEHAVALTRDYPDLFIGQHTNFTIGKPCADPSKIPSMVDENGNFYRSGEYRSGKRSFIYEEVKIETIAQMRRFKELTGHYPEHIEGHAVGSKVIDQVFYDIAKEYGIHASLISGLKDEIEPLSGYVELTTVFSPETADIINHGCRVENFLNDDFGILKADENKVVEMHFHPGFIDQFILDNTTLTLPRCRDLAALCDSQTAKWIKENNIKLLSFGDLKL